MNYLTKDELLDIHAYILERYGGRMGIASQDRLTQVLDTPRQVMFGVELYPDLPSKAAALTFLIMKSHPFVGANEATALMALLRFLHINNARLDEVRRYQSRLAGARGQPIRSRPRRAGALGARKSCDVCLSQPIAQSQQSQRSTATAACDCQLIEVPVTDQDA